MTIVENIEITGHDKVLLLFADGRREPGPPVADSAARRRSSEGSGMPFVRNWRVRVRREMPVCLAIRGGPVPAGTGPPYDVSLEANDGQRLTSDRRPPVNTWSVTNTRP
jgi:hypothetical protein